MERYKYCCDGFTAVKIESMFPILRKVKVNGSTQTVKFYTAVYQCQKCKKLTLRGETNQLREWNTFIEWITEEKMKTFITERDAYELAQRSNDQVPATQNTAS